MPNFKSYNYSQSSMVVINFEDQLQPGMAYVGRLWACCYALRLRLEGRIQTALYFGLVWSLFYHQKGKIGIDRFASYRSPASPKLFIKKRLPGQALVVLKSHACALRHYWRLATAATVSRAARSAHQAS